MNDMRIESMCGEKKKDLQGMLLPADLSVFV
jgi:hypothetical protein